MVPAAEPRASVAGRTDSAEAEDRDALVEKGAFELSAVTTSLRTGDGADPAAGRGC
jgi:hypothetical protein